MLLHHGQGCIDAQTGLAAALEKAVGFLGMIGNLFCMGELADFRLQLFVLALFQLGIADFLILPAKHIQPLGIFPGRCLFGLAFLLALMPEVI